MKKIAESAIVRAQIKDATANDASPATGRRMPGVSTEPEPKAEIAVAPYPARNLVFDDGRYYLADRKE